MDDVEPRPADACGRPASAPPVNPREEIRALLELAALDADMARRQAVLSQALSAVEQVRSNVARLNTAVRADRDALARHEQSGGLAADWETLRHSVDEKEHRSAALARELAKGQAQALAASADVRDTDAALPARRRALTGRISREVLDRYKIALGSERQPAVLATRGTICWGCHLRLPEAVAREFHTSKRVAACPHCLRLLYDSNWLDPE